VGLTHPPEQPTFWVTKWYVGAFNEPDGNLGRSQYPRPIPWIALTPSPEQYDRHYNPEIRELHTPRFAAICQ
jgi:hypothetical protein